MSEFMISLFSLLWQSATSNLESWIWFAQRNGLRPELSPICNLPVQCGVMQVMQRQTDDCWLSTQNWWNARVTRSESLHCLTYLLFSFHFIIAADSVLHCHWMHVFVVALMHYVTDRQREKLASQPASQSFACHTYSTCSQFNRLNALYCYFCCCSINNIPISESRLAKENICTRLL